VLTAVRQPNMRFVAVKSVEQQACLSWHRLRQGFSEERTALINRLRGLLGEFGVWRGRSAAVFTRALPTLEHDEALPLLMRRLMAEARPHLARLDEAIAGCEVEIKNHVKGNAAAQCMTAITGVGPLTAAAVLATVTDAPTSRTGASLPRGRGVVPRQDSSGGKTRLGRITKRGDSYLRGLLTQGARSALQAALDKEPPLRTRLQCWIVQLHARVGYTRPWWPSPTNTRG